MIFASSRKLIVGNVYYPGEDAFSGLGDLETTLHNQPVKILRGASVKEFIDEFQLNQVQMTKMTMEMIGSVEFFYYKVSVDQ